MVEFARIDALEKLFQFGDGFGAATGCDPKVFPGKTLELSDIRGARLPHEVPKPHGNGKSFEGKLPGMI